jgi:hypothetical protein
MRIECSRCGRIWTGGDHTDAGWTNKQGELLCCECGAKNAVHKTLFEIYADLDPPMSDAEMQAFNKRLTENL